MGPSESLRHESVFFEEDFWEFLLDGVGRLLASVAAEGAS